LTLVISKACFVTSNCTVGDNINLKWESARNCLTANSGITVSNIKNISAGNFQLFAGAGDFDFLDGTELKLNWFARLSSVLNWVEDEEVTIIVNEDSIIQASVATVSNENIKVVPGGVLNLDAGVVLTLGNQIDAGDYQIFSGAGSPTFASGSDVKSSWFSDFETAVTKIGTDNVRLIVSSAASIANDCTINANTTLDIPSKGRTLTIADTKTLIINGSFSAGLYQVFSGDGSVSFGTSPVINVYPEWWGAKGDGTTNDYAALNACKDAASEGRWIILAAKKTYLTNTEFALHTGAHGPKLNGNFSTIKAGDTIDAVVSVDGATSTKTQVLNLIIDGDNKATYGFKGVLITEENSLLQNIHVKNALSHGMYFDGCQVMRLENVISNYNAGAGFMFESCNGLIADTIRAVGNTGNGVTVQRGVRAHTGGMQIFNPDIEQNDGHGIEVVDTLSGVAILSGWLEKNGLDGINIGGSARGVSVRDNNIVGGDDGNVYRAVRLQDGSAGCDVIANKFQYSAGTGAFAVVENENTGAAYNRIYPNYYRSNGNVLGTPEYIAAQTSGSWTPGYAPGTGSFTSITYDSGAHEGIWTKTGDVVHVQGNIMTDSIDTTGGSGTVLITGLPYTVKAGNQAKYASGNIAGSSAFVGDMPSAIVALSGTTTAQLKYRVTANDALVALDVSDLATGANGNSFLFSITYIAD